MASKPDKPAPKKGGRRPVLGLEPVRAKLRELHGNQSAVARALGVTRQSVSEFVGKHPELRAELADAREGLVDVAESALFRAVVAGEAWAVCFTLKTQGKDRGYVEKTVVDNRHSGAVTQVHVYLPQKDALPPA